MALIWNPHSEFLREPKLLIPGKKPVGSFKVDTSASIAKDLAAFWCPTPQNGAIDLVNNQFPTDKLGEWGTCPEGIGWWTSTDGNRLAYPYTANYSINGDFTLFWRGYIYGTFGGPMGFMSNRVGSAQDGVWYFYCDSGLAGSMFLRIWENATNNIFFGGWPGTTENVYSMIITMDSATGEGMAYYMRGDHFYQTVTETSDVVFPFTSDPNEITLNALRNNNSSVDGILLVSGMWHRKITDSEAFDLSVDPYQFLIPA